VENVFSYLAQLFVDLVLPLVYNLLYP